MRRILEFQDVDNQAWLAMPVIPVEVPLVVVEEMTDTTHCTVGAEYILDLEDGHSADMAVERKMCIVDSGEGVEHVAAGMLPWMVEWVVDNSNRWQLPVPMQHTVVHIDVVVLPSVVD